MNIPVVSKEYVMAQVTQALGYTTEEIVATDLSMALVEGGNSTSGPAAGDGSWNAAEWETIGGAAWARLLVGPGSDVGALTVGTSYALFVKIADSPEVIIRYIGAVVGK